MKINDFKLKYSNRAIMIFEKIADKPFSISTLTDQYIFFYSVLLANNPESFKMTFDEFIDFIDEPGVLQVLVEWLSKEIAIKSQFSTNKKKQGTTSE